MKKDLIITFADKNYIPQIKQLFSSIYWNAGWDGDYMLLTPDIEEKDLEWFKEKGILIKKIDPPVNYSGLKKFPITLYLIFYLFTSEFKKWRSVIYLDVDIIVRGSLEKLTKLKGFGAFQGNDGCLHHQFYKKFVEESIYSVSKHVGITDEEYEKTFNKLKKEYNLKKPLFNAGVFVFNTDIINKNTFQELKDLFYNYGKISAFAPQGELNLYFYKKWEKIPSIYNVNPYYLNHNYKISLDKINGAILHFSGSNSMGKPWEIINPYYLEWKDNFNKAESINLKKSQQSKKNASDYKIENIRFHLYSNYGKTIQKIDRIIGVFGIFLKNEFPQIYKIAKKYKKIK